MPASSSSEDEEGGDYAGLERQEGDAGSEDGSVYEDEDDHERESSVGDRSSQPGEVLEGEPGEEAEHESENGTPETRSDEAGEGVAKDKVSKESKRPKKRHARNREGTLYDAVAGRLGAQGFIADKNTKYLPLRPDEVLFSRKGAPIRYEEDDMYFQNRHLPEPSPLPDSDLLKAVHTYASDFYGSGHLGDTSEDFQSLDETALIAIGILLEESAKKALGKTGDLAFVEGSSDDGPES